MNQVNKCVVQTKRLVYFTIGRQYFAHSAAGGLFGSLQAQARKTKHEHGPACTPGV